MTRNQAHTAPSDGPSPTPDQIKPVPNATIPYWRTELHDLDEYRSTEQLPSECDIAIIGAGISGVSLAYHLLDVCGEGPKPSITILEARQVCSGATGRNGGHAKVKPFGMRARKRNSGLQAAEEMWAFVHDLIYQMKAVVEKEKLDCEFELRRSFDVFLDEEEAKEVEEFFYASVKNQERWTKGVDFIPASRVEQVTSIKGAKAAVSSPACSLWPYKFVTQLLERIIDSVNLQTDTMVNSVSLDKTSGLQLLDTPRGQIRAKKVVFASNGYTGGLSQTYKDKIVPLRITASHLRPAQPVSPHLSHTYNIGYRPGAVDYLNPRPDGGIVVGGGQPQYSKDKSLWYNVWDDSKQLPYVDEYFGGLMQRNFKGWEDSGSKLNMLWSGIIGYTADEMPHVGETPGFEGKQYVIAGFNGGGMSFCFSSALGLAKMILNGVPFKESGLPGSLQPTLKRLNLPTKAPEDRT